IRVNVRWTRPAVARGKVLKKLDARAGRGAHSCDLQVRAKHLVQMFLLRPKIFAFARLAQPKQITIKMQARFRIRDSNRSMIDTVEEVISLYLPMRIAFVARKVNHLQVVLIGTTKVERIDPHRRGDR